jgi:hypothetical protein
MYVGLAMYGFAYLASGPICKYAQFSLYVDRLYLDIMFRLPASIGCFKFGGTLAKAPQEVDMQLMWTEATVFLVPLNTIGSRPQEVKDQAKLKIQRKSVCN